MKNIILLILTTLLILVTINTVYGRIYTSKDIERLKAFADAGDPIAMNELGSIFSDEGKKTHPNIKTAVKYYEQAAKLGDLAAMSNLGYLYTGILENAGINRNTDKSLDYLKKAASAGYLYAYVNLGIVYDDGLGVPKDLKLAEKYYKIAAEANIPLAQFDLAYFYLHSMRSKENKSYKWFKKAALNGYVNSYSYVTLYYLNGVIVKKDIPKAYMYAKYAKLAGAQGGKNTLEKGILPIITPAEKAEGERLLKEYIKKHPINND